MRAAHENDHACAAPFEASGTACPACNGRGWRIITQDGTRPRCGACEGDGINRGSDEEKRDDR